MATANAATNYLEEKLLKFIFDNNSGSFSTPGASLYVGLATAVSDAEAGSLTEATYTNYVRRQVVELAQRQMRLMLNFLHLEVRLPIRPSHTHLSQMRQRLGISCL